MKWVDSFDLFLFDFDGLLVNTEHLHFGAYQNMLKNRGLDLGWDFSLFCSIAHTSQEGLRLEIYKKFPSLYKEQPDWSILYEEKKEQYLSLLKTSRVTLMPGVENLLNVLKERNKQSCIVTNSPLNQTEIILSNNPTLNIIDHWITREDYSCPKPSAECYLKAIELYKKKGDRVIGFEDTVKGLKALCQTPSKCVLINSSKDKLDDCLKEKGIVHVQSIEMIPDDISYL